MEVEEKSQRARRAVRCNRHPGLDPGSIFLALLKVGRKVDAGSSPA